MTYELMTNQGFGQKETNAPRKVWGEERSYEENTRWENFCNENMPKTFGIYVKEFCKDRKRNQGEGTDAFCYDFINRTHSTIRVDFKFARIFEYSNILFPLEDRCISGTSWTKNTRAVELGVYIVCFWEQKSLYTMAAYPLKDLVELANEKRAKKEKTMLGKKKGYTFLVSFTRRNGKVQGLGK